MLVENGRPRYLLKNFVKREFRRLDALSVIEGNQIGSAYITMGRM